MLENPTPSISENLPTVSANFRSVPEALDYAAKGDTGYNFFNLRGELSRALPYSELRDLSKALARKLMSRFSRGDRIAVIAETSPE
ncbi:MAG: fatty acyl-AMP ligase, partial [Pseudomonadota bacterium]